MDYKKDISWGSFKIMWQDPVPALEDGEYEEVKSVHYDVDSLPLDNNLFGDSMGDSAMPAPSVVPRCDPSAVDTLPCDLPGDFSLAMPSPPPAESSSAASSSLSELDRRILELQFLGWDKGWPLHLCVCVMMMWAWVSR